MPPTPSLKFTSSEEVSIMEIPPISFDKILKCLETDVYPFFYLALESDGSKPNYYFRPRDEFIKL